ncbi:MAG: chemotaxis-specific protein-glutamate methyltransferase CheB [Syntrophorhabdaceae bacterium]|nr:chemotaxis-specific protein-glutamate methyltransferase CheB [Syntrophorhabdaceae bacterium]MDD5242749.1 chemotaxis-specific protein-glutamate methyltransferase CheB [Syntrophorhabdaceae bacterium]
MIKVLIVEDSQVVRDFLTYILSSDPDIQVVGTASNGEEAVKGVGDKRPDIVTMDINMPKMDGYEATRIIMETTPTPIVVVSASWDPNEVKKTFMTMEAGALAAVRKPVGVMHPDHKDQVKELIQMVKLMSEVKVVRRRPQVTLKKYIPVISPVSEPAHTITDIKAVAIGASTGGPPVVEAILSRLPKDFRAPLFIVQHIAPGFVQGFADWLSNSCSFHVKVAEQGESPLPGHAYVAPDGFHMEVDADKRIILNNGEPENGLRPSVSHLFRSVARVFGEHAIGMLLTGMGKDGARELKIMREKGAVTIVQDEQTSVIYGMPGEAVALGAAMHVLSPEAIAILLKRLVGGK